MRSFFAISLAACLVLAISQHHRAAQLRQQLPALTSVERSPWHW